MEEEFKNNSSQEIEKEMHITEASVPSEQPKKKKIGKLLLIILASLLALVILVAGAAYIYANSLLNNIDRTEIPSNPSLTEEEIYEDVPVVDEPDSVEEIEQIKKEFEEAQKIEIKEMEGIDNILLIGVDQRQGNENSGSDSIILVSINYNTGKIHQTSFMRSMYVCIPRPDGAVWGMLNAAYSWGGPNLLVDTIALNFRVDIDRYVVVDYAAFEKGVNLFNGLDMEISDAEADHIKSNSGIPTSGGYQHLNGAQIWAYCQIPSIDNNLKYTDKQRQVISLLAKKALSADIGTLTNAANEMLPHVNTDLTNGEILRYITRCLPMLSTMIVENGRTLPITNEAGDKDTGIIFVDGREMYRVDFDKDIKALHEYIQS